MTLDNKRAYDFKCNTECRTKSQTELEEQFGRVNATVHGYEFNTKCKFPIRIARKLFYGCIWSESVGPWCYTEVTRNVQNIIWPSGHHERVPSPYVDSPINGKWGICSDNCPMEECPKCKFPFKYRKKTYETCASHDFFSNGKDFKKVHLRKK